MKRMF